MLEKLAYRVPEAAELLGLGRAKTYQLVASGELPSIRIGRAVRIPAQALREWLEQKQRDACQLAESAAEGGVM
jgi:excisionase family DNA binding protein